MTTNRNKLFWFLTVLPLLLAIGMFSFLPERIPAHYGFSGELDRWGSRWEVFIIPLTSIILSSSLKIMLANIKSEKYRVNALAAERAFIMIPIIGLVLAVLYLITAMKGIESFSTLPYAKIAAAVISLLIAVAGNYLPKLKRNPLIGIRTKWTLEDEEVWRKTHHFGGLVWLIGGIIMAPITLLFSTPVSFIVLFAGFMVLAIIPIPYSYYCSK